MEDYIGEIETVTPCVGVWIETYPVEKELTWWQKVTPCVGVWIETTGAGLWQDEQGGHTLRGCVD